MLPKINAKKRTLVVDGSILVYRIASALEEATQWEDDMWTLHADLKLGKRVLDIIDDELFFRWTQIIVLSVGAIFIIRGIFLVTQ